MAFRHGKNAEITLNSVALTSYTDELSLSIDGETADTTVFGSTWKTALPGLLGATLEFSGKYDGTVTVGPSSAIIAILGTVVTFSHKPGGTLTGQRTNTGSCMVTNFSEDSSIQEAVAWSVSLLVTGAITSSTQ